MLYIECKNSDVAKFLMQALGLLDLYCFCLCLFFVLCFVCLFVFLLRGEDIYSHLSPCGHLAITDSPIIRTAAKSPIKTDYRRLNEINSRYYGLSNTRNNDTKSVIRGFWSYLNEYKIALKLTCQRKFAEMSYQIY